MSYHVSRTDQGLEVSFAVKQSNGTLRTGLLAGDFAVTVVNPADAANNTPAVAELTQKTGMYSFTIPQVFFGTTVGDYRFVVEIDTQAGPSGAPHVRDSFSGTVHVTQEDIDTLADGGAGTFDRSNDTLEDIRNNQVSVGPIAAAVWSEPVPGAFAGGSAGFILGTNLDALVSSRASQTSVDDIQNVTRVAITIPKLLIPDSGGPTLYKLTFNMFDTSGNPEDPDGPDIVDVTAENHAGTSRTANLGGTPTGRMTKLGVGRYEITYSVATTHAIEQLIFRFTYAENAVTFTQDRVTNAVATLEDHFTAADRSDLQAVLADTAVMEPLVSANLDAAVSSRATQAQILSDATPFPGANIDAAVSSRATQADILNDATPFPGGNIDTTISSRASQTSLDALDAAVRVASTTVAVGSTALEVRTGLTQPDDFFEDVFILVINTAGVAVRKASAYTNTNGAFLLDDPLPFTPVNGDVLEVLAKHDVRAGAAA